MNLKHIRSKTSLNSSSLNNRELTLDEKSKLLHEVELLKGSVKYLSDALENQDAAVKILSNEKEKLYLELKSVQRVNRNIKQELDDEREIHFKEKEYLIGEIMKYRKNPAHIDNNFRFNDFRSYHEKKIQDNNYNMLQQQLNIKDDVIFKICSKYMKISFSKKCVQNRLRILQHQTQEMCKNIISLLQENQDTLDLLINNLLIFSKLSSPGKKYLHDLKSIGHLHYENMQLKTAIFYLKTHVLQDDRRYRNCTSTADYTTITKSEGKIKSHFNFDGHIITQDKRKKNARNDYFNTFLKSKSDSFLVFNR